MVRYWKTKTAVEAKVIQDRNGVTVMKMDGEDYLFPGFPRGHILFGRLSKLKHEIKNQIFNDSWVKLEEGHTEKEVANRIRTSVLPIIYAMFEKSRYDIVPPHKMALPVREIYRAWTKVAPQSPLLRDILCHILQEDDGYRFRLQWIVTYFNPNSVFSMFRDPINLFDKALIMLEHAEVIGDMKERIRLLRRVLMAILSDKGFRDKFIKFCREVDWGKVRLSEADKYFFRGKWFKVDLDKFEY